MAELTDALWPDCVAQFSLTLPILDANLALDEALLQAVDNDPQLAYLRFWESNEYAVILGRSNRPDTEVFVDACRTDRVPILRRASGGGAVLIGPGCLCYSLVLPTTSLHKKLGVSGVTGPLMMRSASGLNQFVSGVDVRGTSDLVWNGLKVSGNAQRWLRNAFIHHGTILYAFDLDRVGRYLAHPSREPDYRQSRRHQDFVTNLPLDVSAIRDGLSRAWKGDPADCPPSLIDAAHVIAASRRGQPEWQVFLPTT